MGVTNLSLLFDTNVFIACEDIGKDGVHINAHNATKMKELAQEIGCQIFLHPESETDLKHTKDKDQRDASLLKFRQWKRLKAPNLNPELGERAGYFKILSDNDRVDLNMLAALDVDAVEILVTEDKLLQGHATKAGFGDRVLSIQGTIEYLERLSGKKIVLPTVELKKVYQLPANDAIFTTLRDDYPDFDNWFKKASKEHRDCLVIVDPDRTLEAVVILKVEYDSPWGLSENVLKVCTLKVSDRATGSLRGELMLKAVFEYAKKKQVNEIYAEVFDKHEGIIHLLKNYGFHRMKKATSRGELILAKNYIPPPETNSIDPLTYHRDFGPPALIIRDVFVVPVVPFWHDVLFPESQNESQLFGPEPSGNAIMKAYLSRSRITKLKAGSTLLFYRSKDIKAVTAIGIVDKVIRSDDPIVVRRFVGLRTVYRDAEIQDFCMKGKDVLAILFRHDRSLKSPWSIKELKTAGVLKGPPQSIHEVTDEGGMKWLHKELIELH